MIACRTPRLLVILLPGLFFLILWEGLARSGLFNINLFPPPSTCLNALIASVVTWEFWRDLLYSSQRIVLGYAIGVSLGITAGVCTGRKPIYDITFGQILQFLRPVPPVAIVPLAILWFGLGESSKYFLVAWGSFFPVWINTHLGVSRVDRTYIWAARSLGALDRQILREVVLPAALPMIIAGMRTSIAIAFICVFVAEMAGAYEGIGFRISLSHLVFRADRMIALLAVLGGLGAATDWGFTYLVEKLFPWYSSAKRE
jgi:ABC-type nitrate/sulfonate/bicarbonate transport system permease component